ncbi:MAG TPA: hypothetical protein VJN18_09190 [Polyangiaceae bacterium]|nr:hypothetical protein [Polyangiaceae bacterium]
MNDLSSPEVKQAEREVERRKAELSLRLRRAGESGERMARRLGEQLKPALVGVAVAGGAALLVGAVILVARRRRHVGWSVPQRPSRASPLLQSAGLMLLRLVARQVAVALVRRVAPPLPAHSVESAQ